MEQLDALESMAQQLDAHPDYRVLRRLKDRDVYDEVNPGTNVFRGIYLDTETTGLDTAKASVIELGIVPFDYSSDGQILRVHHDLILSQFNDPGDPIPEMIVQLTSISNDMVAGQRINPNDVDTCVRGAHLVIAHNASFDRPVAERYWPVLANMNWACSMKDIPWMDEGIFSAGLEQIGTKLGFFFDGHRAVDDCLAGIEILGQTLPITGRPVLSLLLENARQTTVRIRATGAPFDVKHDLKSRGYKWDPGNSAVDKAWWIDVLQDNLSVELEWLGERVFPNRNFSSHPLPMETISAKTRYRK